VSKLAVQFCAVGSLGSNNYSRRIGHLWSAYRVFTSLLELLATAANTLERTQYIGRNKGLNKEGNIYN
jgi:hypothetical protein